MRKVSVFKFFLFTATYLLQVKVHAEWRVDTSRRQLEFTHVRNVAGQPTAEVVEALGKAVVPVEIGKDIVIVQTEAGFVPATLNLQKGQIYQLHVINLNPKEKNVSFLMDSFSQSHNTVYGQMKSFKITPHVEGVFSYQSPETGAAGQAVVITDKVKVRKIAAENKGR